MSARLINGNDDDDDDDDKSFVAGLELNNFVAK